MSDEHQVPIWFFIGVTLLIYGVIITATGLYGLVDPSLEAGIAMNWLHTSIWWGGLMTVIGAFYVIRFWPSRGRD